MARLKEGVEANGETAASTNDLNPLTLAAKPVRLDLSIAQADKSSMEIAGRVENGVVVFVGGNPLPDGTPVSIICPIPTQQQSTGEKRRIQLPLVHCQQPGSVHLTNERIGEILDGQPSNSSRAAKTISYQ